VRQPEGRGGDTPKKRPQGRADPPPEPRALAAGPRRRAVPCKGADECGLKPIFRLVFAKYFNDIEYESRRCCRGGPDKTGGALFALLFRAKFLSSAFRSFSMSSGRVRPSECESIYAIKLLSNNYRQVARSMAEFRESVIRMGRGDPN